MTVAVSPRRTGPPVPVPTENPLTLAVLGRPALAFAVYGLPTPQGSKSYKGKKRIITKAGEVKRIANLVESSDEDGSLTAWREKVAGAALAALPYGFETLDGPLVMDLTVSLPRPSRTPKTLRTVPHTKPDLDKLVRAIADGLGTTAPKIDYKKRKIIAEDSRIQSFRKGPEKVWERDPLDSDALPQPGAVIRLWRYPETLLGKIVRITP